MVDDKHFSFVAPFRVFFAMNFMKFHNAEKMKYVLQYGVREKKRKKEKKKKFGKRKSKNKKKGREFRAIYMYINAHVNLYTYT